MNTDTITVPRAAFVLGALISLVALCLAAPAPGTAAATPGNVEYADYRVKIEGSQKTDWTYNHEKMGECDSNAAGGGSERLKFASPAFRVRAYFGLGGTNPVTFLTGKPSNPSALNEVPLKAKMTREGKIDRWGEVSENCPGGDGTGGIAPDCGTRTDKGTVELDYDYKQTDLLVLGSVEGFTDNLYRNCPGGGSQWPYLLDATTSGDTIGQTIEPGEMKKAGQYVVLAEGSYRNNASDWQEESSIRWSVNFKRIGKVHSKG
jgi:hypothetical protein